MKTNTKPREVFSNVDGAVKFTIKANGKAFKALVKDLYSNKPNSITREIWSNAYDAHCAVGKSDVPFDVSFPTIFDSSFRVRDYGPGMTDEQIKGLYSTVFESTKEDTNDQIGQFGLGSKSPFSYTDTFSVVSWNCGMKRFYVISLDQDGIPQTTLMGKEETDEPSGLEVSFTVNREDVSSFQQAAIEVSKGFDVKPNVTNGKNHQWPEQKVVLKGKSWKKVEGLKAGPYVKMGCVLYPFDTKDVNGSDYYWHSNPYQSVILEAPVGSLAVSLSRESLSFGKDEPTKDTLNKLMETYLEEIVGEAQKGLDECKTYEEASVFYYKLPYWLKQKYLDGYWCGVKLVDRMYIPNACSISSYDPKYRHKDPYIYNCLVLLMKTIIFIEDVTAGTKKVVRVASRIREYISNNSTKRFIWVKMDKNRADAQDNLDLIEYLFSDVEFIHVGDLPDVTPKSYARKGSYMVKNTNYQDVNLSGEHFEKGGAYVRMFKDSLEGIKSGVSSRDFKTIVGQEVYMVQRTNQKRFESAKQWVDVTEVINNFMEDNHRTLLMLKFAKRLHRIPEYVEKISPKTYDVIQKRRQWAENHKYRNLDCVDRFYPDIEYAPLAVLKEKVRREYPILDIYNLTGPMLDHYINLVKESKK